jgi:hypothetical protein
MLNNLVAAYIRRGDIGAAINAATKHLKVVGDLGEHPPRTNFGVPTLALRSCWLWTAQRQALQNLHR